MRRYSPARTTFLVLCVVTGMVGLSSCGGGGGSGGPGPDVTIRPPSDQPDLAVGRPSVSDSSPDAGASITLSATVRNAGDGRSAATTLRYYRSSDATITTSDTAVGTDAVSGLSASGTSAESIRLTVPSRAGTYYYGACVDAVSGESDTANNCSGAVRVNVSAGGGGNTFGVGDALPGVPTSGSFIPARLSGGASLSSSGGTTTITFSNGGVMGLQDGTVYTCRAAGGCQVRNGRVTRGTIVRGGGTPPPSDAPDLEVGSLSVSDASPDAGASFTLRATVRNAGASRSVATTLRYYRSSDATVSASDTAVGTDVVGALSASGTSAESISLAAPSSVGTYYYGACVDTVSGESDTTNNCSSAVRVTVSASGGNSFGVGAALPGVPTSGSFVPARLSGGASLSSSGGSTTVTFGNGGVMQLQDGTVYTCRASGGCQVRNGVVTRGTIVRGGGTPPPSDAPDLEVGSLSVSDASPDAGASFTLRATVRNAGASRSVATTLRYYRSSDATVSASDTAVGTDAVGALSASGTSAESISLAAPSSAGTYYYGACVDTVSGESDTTNNCSSSVRVIVSSRDDHSDSRSGATRLSLGNSRSGQIETSGDIDWFRVQIGAGDQGTLRVFSTGALDTVGELQSSSGATIESDDDGGSGRNFLIEWPISSGTYFIKVGAYRSATGSYTIHAEIEHGGPASVPDHPIVRGRFSPSQLTLGERAQLILTWNRVSGATSYRVRVEPSLFPILYTRYSDGRCTVSSSDTTQATRYTHDFTANYENVFRYLVLACNSAGCSCPP